MPSFRYYLSSKLPAIREPLLRLGRFAWRPPVFPASWIYQNGIQKFLVFAVQEAGRRLDEFSDVQDG